MAADIFIPDSSKEDAIVEALHTVTYVTGEKEGIEKAFVEGYGLQSSGWVSPLPSERQALNTYFGFSNDDWESCAFYKTGAGANIQVRAIYNPIKTPSIRHEYDGLIVGGATVSFPKEDLYSHERLMAKLGIKSTIGVKEMEFESPSGEVYVSAEIVYLGPEHTYLLAVKRPDIFVPVGPMDPVTGIGGAAYSARCVANADEVNEFLHSVLGFEIRRDVTFTVGERSALLLPEGVEERFIQAFAPGSSSGYLVIMDHGQNNRTSQAPDLASPHRGIVMWSFKTKDIDQVHDRAIEAGIEILQAPDERKTPHIPCRKTLLMKDPGGFLIEVFEDE